ALLLGIASSAQADRGECGQPKSNGKGPNTTDALRVLKVAVGHVACMANDDAALRASLDGNTAADDGDDGNGDDDDGDGDNDACTTNAECDFNEACSGGACEDTCVTNADCDGIEECQTGFCNDTDLTCATNADCDVDGQCLTGNCVADDEVCATNADCGSGE